jgi:chromosome segregation ATPase
VNKNSITVDEVKNAIAQLRSRNEPPTIDRLRQEIGRGSLTTLLRFRNEILEPEMPEAETNPEALNAFRQVWQGAMEIGRKGEVGKTAEARTEVEALRREAERLENECGLLETQLDETRQALNRALEEATAARQEAKEARGALASEQANATQSERERGELLRQIADLQRVLRDEKAKASKLEGKLEMIETQVIPQIAEARQSLNHALADATTARQEAKEVRVSIAAEQTRAAESEREKADLFRQIADLQRMLGDEKARASKLEAKVDLLENQVIPQTAEEMRAKLKRKGIT